jgi:hypothetical protein
MNIKQLIMCSNQHNQIQLSQLDHLERKINININVF